MHSRRKAWMVHGLKAGHGDVKSTYIQFNSTNRSGRSVYCCSWSPTSRSKSSGQGSSPDASLARLFACKAVSARSIRILGVRLCKVLLRLARPLRPSRRGGLGFGRSGLLGRRLGIVSRGSQDGDVDNDCRPNHLHVILIRHCALALPLGLTPSVAATQEHCACGMEIVTHIFRLDNLLFRKGLLFRHFRLLRLFF